MNQFDNERAIKLLIGIIAVYTIYSVIGVIQQAVIKITYQNDETGEQDHFDFPEAQLLMSALCAVLITGVYNIFTISKSERNCIPSFQSFKCGSAVTFSYIAYTYAIQLTNFPVVMMMRCCGILSVVLVGVLFTGVKDTTLKLGKKKILIAVIATIGIIIFKIFDQNAEKTTRQSELLGILLMVVSLLADGFLPDFQAVVKSEFKPKPTVMLVQINKWAGILCLSYSIAVGNLIPIITFLSSHLTLLLDLILIGVLSTIGQFFIYHLVKNFKQHIVPFIITTRKMFTVGLSIIYYNHNITFLQVVGLIMVFGISFFEFYEELEMTKAKTEKTIPIAKTDDQSKFAGVDKSH